jgi:hypothetical protein
VSFFKHLLSDDGIVSSKRFAGIASFLNAVILGYLPNTKEFVFDGFLLFSAGVLGVTIFEKKTKHERPKDTGENTATTSQSEGGGTGHL